VSKPRRIDAIERTATMLDLIRQRYPTGDGMSLSHVVIEEVAPGTGWGSRPRWADALALSVWPSKGLTLDGYEVKATRADLKRELADPTKHVSLARYCDAWWLVAWDEGVLVDGVPESWGILLTRDGEDGERELVVHRKAPPQTPEPWPRAFVCSLVRNAYEQSPGAAYVARACAEAAARGRRDAEYLARNARDEAARAIAVAIYGENSWKWPKEAKDTERLLRIAAERLTQGTLELAARAGEGGSDG
jgi:hypothetical protein